MPSSDNIPPAWRTRLAHATSKRRKWLRVFKFLLKTTNTKPFHKRVLDGNTLLHVAVQDSSCGLPPSLTYVNYLIELFPEAMLIENKDRHTPLDLAMRQDELDNEIIAALLAHWPLRDLDLKAGYTSCSLGPDMTRLITMYNFDSMDVSKVHLTKDGLTTFLKAMAINKSTKRLTLNLFEYLDQEVCAALEDMLIRNKIIQSITLRLTRQTAVVTQRLQLAIVKGLENNYSLMELVFCAIPQYTLPLMMTATHRENIHSVSRREIDHYLALNQAGRARLLDTTLTMRQFVNMISEFSDNESVSLDLLRMVPHLWAN